MILGKGILVSIDTKKKETSLGFNLRSQAS